MKKQFSLFLMLCICVFEIDASYPPNYYEALNGKTGAVLKTALHEIICQDTTQYLNYGSGNGRTWQGFYSTDRNESNNSIVDMYSSEVVYFPADYVVSGYKGFGSAVQIEHSVPKSWWKCDIKHPDCAAKDLNHLYPANGSMNASKNNNPLGVVSGKITKDNGVSKVGMATYDDYTGNVFEPANEYKGDFARSYFYVATAYEHYTNKWDTSLAGNMMQANTYPTLKSWAVNLLLQWHRQDPVSERERTRTDKVFDIQKNRNPFIDFPELVEYIWGDRVGSAWNVAVGLENNVSNLQLIFNSNQNSILIQSTENLAVSISVYTIDGKMILQQNTSTNTLVSFSQMLKGIYIVRAVTDREIITRKVIF